MKAARKEAARDTVEVMKVAKASLDDGEQMLAIARQKALRLASIEGRKLFGEQPPCLRLVLVRVGDEMDLDALLCAAHCGSIYARATNESRERELGPSSACVGGSGRFDMY